MHSQLRALIHPDDHTFVLEELACAAAREGEYETEFRVKWPDESEHWLAVKGQIIRDPVSGVRQVAGAPVSTSRR